jgi:hypothetical protein
MLGGGGQSNIQSQDPKNNIDEGSQVPPSDLDDDIPF